MVCISILAAAFFINPLLIFNALGSRIDGGDIFGFSV